MSPGRGLSELSFASGLLVDTNLLVLFTVGRVARNRIGTFKRTRQYTAEDYDLLIRVLNQFNTFYTVPHVLAEVSNLIDLPGHERMLARQILKETISVLGEVNMPSERAARDKLYPKLGLGDAAIASAVRELKCAVLTDDLDLYLSLTREDLEAFNFTHVRAGAWGL